VRIFSKIFKNKLVSFPKKGKLLVITDLHGNQDDYLNYVKLWDCENPNCHILFNGDLIHGFNIEDKSVEILNEVIEKSEKYDNFHFLLGNHEWSHITNNDIFKRGINQKNAFKDLIKLKYGSINKLKEYVQFFKSLPLIAKTDNGIFISHGGPSKEINSKKDFKLMLERSSYISKDVNGFLWERWYNFTPEDIDNFLDIVECNVMLVGHTPVEKVVTNGNQLIFTSSYGPNKKAYLEIDLEKKVESAKDIKKMVKYI